ncbi:MAG: polysaccharide deacetylase family protein [Acidobacteriota bacterium]
MMKLLTLTVFLPSSAACYVTAQDIAFTFDDGPKMDDTVRMSPAERNTALLTHLREAGVKAALFYKSGNASDNQLELVRRWGEAGHMIGNHTMTHPYFNSSKVSVKDLGDQLLGCDAVIKTMPGYAKLFRFPYLKEGETAEKRDGFRAFMKLIGYKPGPVSVDASDWYYNERLYKRLASDPTADIAPYRKAYMDHLYDRACYYDALSKTVMGRSVKHVLLMHHSLINALFLGDAIRMFREKGWRVIDAQVAFQDPVYVMEPNVLPAGESIIWELAKEKGVQGLRYPGEDSQYEEPILDRLGL